jgi:hypothetical protein
MLLDVLVAKVIGYAARRQHQDVVGQLTPVRDNAPPIQLDTLRLRLAEAEPVIPSN